MSEYIMYLRKSRADAGSESVEVTLLRHRERLMELCSAMRIQCGTILQEVGSADSIAARPEMMRLLSLVETGAYDGVVCIDMDRLSRGSGADQALVINTFKYSDTKVITPQKTYDFGLEVDEQFAELSLFMAKQEYRQIKKRLAQGRMDSIKEGKWMAVGAPYGYERYKLHGQKGYALRILPEEAEKVRQMFDWYTNELIGYQGIADKLNAAGIRNRSCSSWHHAEIANIICSPIYTGKLIYQKKVAHIEMQDGQPVKKIGINKNPVIVDGMHDAIITEETFQRAVEIREKRTIPRIHADGYLVNPFRGLIRCGICSGTIKSRVSVQNGTERHALYCKNACGCVGSYVELVETAVVKGLQEWLRAYEFAPEETQEAHSEDFMKKTRISLSEKLKAQKSKLERCMDAYEQGVYDLEEFKRRSECIKAQIEDIKIKLEDINEKIDAFESNRSELVPKMRSILEKYEDLDTKGKNILMHEILERIEYKKTSRGRNHMDDFEVILYPKVHS